MLDKVTIELVLALAFGVIYWIGLSRMPRNTLWRPVALALFFIAWLVFTVVAGYSMVHKEHLDAMTAGIHRTLTGRDDPAHAVRLVQ